MPQGGQPAAPRRPMDLAKTAPLVIAGLGVLNFIWGFLPSFSTGPGIPDSVPTSVYATGPGYLPILLLVAGLLALGAVLPKPVRVVFPTAALTLAATIGVLVVGFITGGTVDLIASVGEGSGPSKGIGLILLLIFAIVQTIAAVGWWLIDAGIVSPSGTDAGAPAGQAGPHPGPANPPSGGMPSAAPSGPWPGAGPAGPPPGGPGPHGPVGPPPGGPDFGAPGHQPGPSGEQPGPGMDQSGPFAAPPAPVGGPSSGPTPAVGRHDEPAGDPGFGAPPPGSAFDPAPGGGRPPAPDPGPGRPETPAVPGSGDDDNPEETQQLRF